MRIAIYARVSTESQEARGTIGSQLDVLRKRVAAEGHEQVAEYCDDGWSGARLDRPGLDALRDAAEAGRLRRRLVLIPGSPSPYVCLSSHCARRTGAPWRHGVVPRHPASCRRPASPVAHSGTWRDS